MIKKNYDEKIISFKGCSQGEPFYENGDFKMYGFNVSDKDYPEVHHSKYGSVSVTGNIIRLSIGQEYNVKAREKYNNTYGYSYEVIQIAAEKPKTVWEQRRFLEEILTPNQVTTLLDAYPNLLDMIMDGHEKDIDVSKLKGIGESSLQKIIDKINANFKYASLMAEFDGLFSFSVIKKLYEQYSSLEMVKKKLQEDPYAFLESIDRIGFKRADQIILKYEKDGKLLGSEPFLTSKQRCKAFILYVLKDNLNNGNTCMNIVKLQKQCVNEVKDCAKYFVDCIKEDDIYYDKDKKLVTFKTIYKKEKFISEKLVNALRSSSKNKNGFDIDKFKTCGEIELTNEQIQALHNLNNYTVSMFVGFAGSGKTATTEAIIKMLEDNKKSYILLAPTGRAGKVLSEYTHRTASTIHRGLGYSPMTGWTHNHDNPLSNDFVIVDEFSMVDVSLFYRLLDAIDFDKTKLLMIGDAAQLASVKAGNCLHDMMDSKVIPVAELTKVFRYSEGGLMTVATDCRNQKPYLKDCTNKVTQFGTHNDYVFIRSGDSEIVRNALGMYKKLLSDGIKPDDIMVTSAYNIGDYGIITLNNQLQKIANKNYGSDNCFEMKDVTYYLDDIVMQTVNNYNSKEYDIKSNEILEIKHSVYNGETGKVVKITNRGIVVKFDTGNIFYNKKELQTIQLGYAFTTHKSQGGSADYVIILSPKAHTFMLTSNLLYVALTRTKLKCYQFGSDKVINRAAKKKEEVKRSTFLKDFLQIEKI